MENAHMTYENVYLSIKMLNSHFSVQLELKFKYFVFSNKKNQNFEPSEHVALKVTCVYYMECVK